ncbi:hypothetical protein M758_5G198000 [Ceratodon purpureus]|uniref:Uncharacterized protein n=1 Tax=Ceratodon purpureus TaxID=3225 RepID=A0A8T0I3M2_CERPU|nr:hypothetical protein KC19_5G204300 [Ceratodon purpureus]KAG0617550.1 hypothetical protein M758_5G198000 [Ceratodon purpureus]
MKYILTPTWLVLFVFSGPEWKFGKCIHYWGISWDFSAVLTSNSRQIMVTFLSCCSF